MITEQDLELLERLYTPLAKILLKHLREDHGYNSTGDRFATLSKENDELCGELASLKADYVKLQRINRELKKQNYNLILISEILE